MPLVVCEDFSLEILHIEGGIWRILISQAIILVSSRCLVVITPFCCSIFNKNLVAKKFAYVLDEYFQITDFLQIFRNV